MSPSSPQQGWAEYAEYARRLDSVRAEENARTAGIREGVAQMSEHADELVALLDNQRYHLTAFAQKAKLTFPPGAGTPPEGRVEPQTDLARVAQLIDEAESQGADAHNRAIRPNLLPGLSGGLRGFVVFGVTALVIMAVQFVGFATTGNNPDFLRYGVLVPLVGFGAASLLLRVGNKGRDPDLAPAPVPTRLGLLMCFGALPVLFLILIAANRS
ncbi:hypothetical protein [Kineosporia sp. NBRC 101731]|uniref:hypothetical protein n=1 Tax=Kineosporia sp. NBRC 101731 TaxID=3032199 RepID=UPI0024A3876F|nr:hypothetical protein [Kineosporia sp. NBRC 101731]GLY27867.1 hypothetical protein Kisp02_12320 [Kineosporia sp. NBRC 101731]